MKSVLDRSQLKWNSSVVELNIFKLSRFNKQVYPLYTCYNMVVIVVYTLYVTRAVQVVRELVLKITRHKSAVMKITNGL